MPTEQEISFISVLAKAGLYPVEIKKVFSLAQKRYNLNLKMANDGVRNERGFMTIWTIEDDNKRTNVRKDIFTILNSVNLRHEIGGDARYYTIRVFRDDKDESGVEI